MMKKMLMDWKIIGDETRFSFPSNKEFFITLKYGICIQCTNTY